MHASATYRPSLWAKLSKLESRQRAALMAKIATAATEDERVFQGQFKEWKTQHSDWSEERDIALRILDGDRQAKLDAIEAFESFEEISHLGSSIQMIVHEGGCWKPSWLFMARTSFPPRSNRCSKAENCRPRRCLQAASTNSTRITCAVAHCG